MKRICSTTLEVQLMNPIINVIALSYPCTIQIKNTLSWEDKDDELFTISLFIVLKRVFLMKSLEKGYLKMLFKDFVEEFDMSDDNCIWWSSSSFFLMNGFGLPVNDKDKRDVIISKLRLQRYLQQILLTLL